MIIVQTVSTAFFTADLTADSSRTSKMQGNALPPAFSTVDKNPYTFFNENGVTIHSCSTYSLQLLYKWYQAILDVAQLFLPLQ